MSFFFAMEKASPARGDAFRPLTDVKPVPIFASTGCRWPVNTAGDPLKEAATHCCGARRSNLKIFYCDEHQRMAIGAGTPSERGAVRAARAVAA